MMRILQCHNSYLYPGGEDTVAHAEATLLRTYGHDVVECHRSNKEIAQKSIGQKITYYAKGIYYAQASYDEVRTLIDQYKPEVAHFHNSFFLLGPAAYHACFDAGVPVVQTLHNYRFLCAAGTFYRDGAVCEDCLPGSRMPGIAHGCWHGSRVATFVMTRVVESYYHQGILPKISCFVALSEFSRRKFIEAGWNAERITVEGNFLEQDPGVNVSQGEFVLYLGALQAYKGVRTLLKAWGSKGWPMPLKIAGSGPLERALKAMGVKGVDWLGQQSPAQVVALIKQASCVVVPSECYENFPRAIVEAYACGVPVIASDLGALRDIVTDNNTGLLFKPGDSVALASRISYVLDNPQAARRLAQQARRLFEDQYTGAAHYRRLLRIYEKVSGHV